VLDHTRQGFYGSPRHGGNRDYASYRMLGLAYPNLIGQNRYANGRPI
jgi:gluconate 2-dehydrogenase gamma chain